MHGTTVKKKIFEVACHAIVENLGRSRSGVVVVDCPINWSYQKTKCFSEAEAVLHY
jgi:MinD-like ATPase involved in chromosome partitioning or flagellar assembly